MEGVRTICIRLGKRFVNFGIWAWILDQSDRANHALSEREFSLICFLWRILNPFGLPPTTYYGVVKPGLFFNPTVGLTVTAWIDGQNCGQGSTMEIDNQVVYAIDVFSEDPSGTSGCGRKGKIVHFRVGDHKISTVAVWNNSQVWELPLDPTYRVYFQMLYISGR